MSEGSYYVRVPYSNVASYAYGNGGQPDRVTVATEPGKVAGPFDVMPFSRGKIEDAITAWRNGQTYDAIHPLAERDDGVVWDENAMKDLARVIAATLAGGTPPEKPLPWNGARTASRTEDA